MVSPDFRIDTGSPTAFGSACSTASREFAEGVVVVRVALGQHLDADLAVLGLPVAGQIRRQVVARHRLGLQRCFGAGRERPCSGGTNMAWRRGRASPDRPAASLPSASGQPPRGLGARTGLASPAACAGFRRALQRATFSCIARRRPFDLVGIERRLQHLGAVSRSASAWRAGRRARSCRATSRGATLPAAWRAWPRPSGRRLFRRRQHVDGVGARVADPCADRGRSRSIRPSGCAG